MRSANDNTPIGNNPLRFLSVCSGIEAASVAFGPLGWKAVAFSEIEKFPSAVLAHHYPDVPNLGDFTAIDVSTLGRVDVLCGGTPCQAFSVAGLRNSLDDARGNLSLEFVRLAHELANGNGLRNVIWENVPGVLSTKDNAFGCFLGGLVGADDALPPPADASGKRRKWPNAGMVSGPKGRAAWRILDAQYFGLAQRRKRVIVVADFGNGADPAAVLFERAGLSRNPPARGKAGQDVAATISERTKGGGGLGTDFDLDGGLIQTFDRQSNCEYGDADIASTVSARDYESPTDLVAQCITGEIRHALKAEGADASEDGTGRGNPIVAQTVAIRGRDGGATAELGGEVATALRASGGGGDKAHVMVNYADELHGTLSASEGGTLTQILPVVTQSAVRRLTPVECERLQGFPDNYTNIPWRGKPHSPDGPRYKALGNSWAVPKFTWIGERIARFMPPVSVPVAANNNEAINEAA